ncbi:hypothetical protein VaNZ11_010521, partial [Volvox africanus]
MSLGVEPLESREFLSSCLKAALDDPDLIDAISDQALEQGFSALTIGQGLVSVDQLKDKLYLTVDEAKSVLNICTSMVAGRCSLKQSSSDQLSINLQQTQSGGLAMRMDVQQVDGAPVNDTHLQDAHSAQQTLPFESLDMIMENAAVVVVSRTTQHTSEKKIIGACAPDTLPCPTPTSCLSPAAERNGGLTKPADTTFLKPVDTKTVEIPVAATAPKPAAVSAPATETPKPAVTKPDNGKPASAVSKSTEQLYPEVSAVSPRIPSPSSGSTPSYLRPTAAHKARVSKDAEASASSNLAPVQEDTPEQRKRRTLFSRMASTFLAPTQAFVARVTGRSEEAKTKMESPVSKASVHLEAVLNSPQGQRVTKPQPFALRSDMRSKSSIMSTEELELAEAREKAFKRNPVPKHVYESRPIVPTPRSAPKDPNEVFEPFQLASVELHNKKMEEMRKKAEDEAAREEEARRFKARSFQARIASSPITPPKPSPNPPTRAEAPVFASEARISYYHEVIEPAKKAKEAEANREKMEAERKLKELEDMNVDDYRKTLEFKARPMPNFSSPFRVDPSLSRSVTVPEEPKLRTSLRLGAATAREDKEGHGLGNGLYDGAGYVDPFFASLRKSTSVRTSIKSNPSSRRNSALRQSASAALLGNGATTPK